MSSEQENNARQKYVDSLISLVTVRTEHLRKSLSNLELCYDIVLESFGQSLALKHAESEKHSKRVTAFSNALARAAGVSTDRMAVIARGAFLHDIGKLATDDAILRKPNALTADETARMREHCVRGYELVKVIPFLTEAAEVVYSHHEWYDGTGYPRGLKGEGIPIGARVVAIANALDSITSNLPYRPAQSLGAAKAEIERGAGSQFDPALVKTFLSMPDSLWGDLRRLVQTKPNESAGS
jgi:putative nucleotidyltransferase with HDIG domain